MNDQSKNARNYNLSQLMVTAAAREIADGEVVFVGMRLPLLGFLLAKSTHAPAAIGVYELGIVRDTPAPEPLMTMGDLPNLCRAQWLAVFVKIDQRAALCGQSHRGEAGFIGPLSP